MLLNCGAGEDWRLLGVLWTARRSKQVILQKNNPEYSLEGLMLKLKLQYFGHLMQRTDSLEKTLMPGKTEGRRREWQQMRGWMRSLTQWTWICANSGRSWRTGKPAVHQSMGWRRVGHDLATEQQMHRSYWFYAMMSSISLGKFLASISSNMVHATFLVSPPLGFQRQS